MKACLSVWGVTALPIAARRAALRTIRPAPCRSSRRPSAARNTGPPVRSPMARSIARAVRGASGMVTILPPLRVIVSVRCPLQAQVLDVRAGGLGDPQAVEREQGDQRMLCRRAEPGGDQQGAELVAVQCGRVGLVVHPRPPDVRGWRVIQEFFLDGVAVEPGDGAQPAGDRCAGPSLGLQVAGEAFDVGAADGEQGQGVGAAPGGELAQVKGVGLPGQAAVSGQVPGEGEPFGVGEGGLDRGERG